LEVEEEITPRTICRDDDEKETEDGTLFPMDDSDDSDDDDDDEADIPESARMCVVYLPLNIIIAPLLVGVTRSALWSTF
jgi:hypothetical protein